MQSPFVTVVCAGVSSLSCSSLVVDGFDPLCLLLLLLLPPCPLLQCTHPLLHHRQVEGSEENWFVYKLPKKNNNKAQQQQQQAAPGAGADAADEDTDMLSDTVSVGRHTITKVSTTKQAVALRGRCLSNVSGSCPQRWQWHAARRAHCTHCCCHCCRYCCCLHTYTHRYLLMNILSGCRSRWLSAWRRWLC